MTMFLKKTTVYRFGHRAFGLLAACTVSAVFGNEPSPTPIANATALNSIVREHLDGDYVLTDDLYLNETDTPWVPIGNVSQPFTGTLDGNDRFVYGLNVTTQGIHEPAGLFGFMRNAWVQRLMLDRPTVLSTGNGSPAGAVAGEMERSNVTDSINYLGRVRTEGGRSGSHPHYRYPAAGGLVGWMKDHSRVENNLNTGGVSTNGTFARAGGAVGYATNYSPTTGNLNTGGE